MDCSLPGSCVLCCLPEFAQIHVHWVSDTNRIKINLPQARENSTHRQPSGLNCSLNLSLDLEPADLEFVSIHDPMSQFLHILLVSFLRTCIHKPKVLKSALTSLCKTQDLIQQEMVSTQPSNCVQTDGSAWPPVLTTTEWATIVSHLDCNTCCLGSQFLPKRKPKPDRVTLCSEASIVFIQSWFPYTALDNLSPTLPSPHHMSELTSCSCPSSYIHFFAIPSTPQVSSASRPLHLLLCLPKTLFL